MGLAEYFFGLEAQRKRLIRKAPEGPLKQFLSVPTANPEDSIMQSQILAVDFETTGLKAKRDHIISVGFVSLDRNQIRLESSYHEIIDASGELDASNVVIHQITDQAKSGGKPLALVIEALLSALAGKIMLVHFAHIEKTFLEQACLKLYGMAPVFPVIDTFALAKRRYDRCHEIYAPSSLHLASLRREYGLPYYRAHNALSDAIATAELFIAKVQRLPQREETSVKGVLI